MTQRVRDIRQQFAELLFNKRFTSVNREKTMLGMMGNTTIEIVNASFIADEDSIFGEVNWEYVKREEEWYNSQSLNINDIPNGAPAIWKAVADTNGYINSNYGWCVYSPANVTDSRIPLSGHDADAMMGQDGFMNQYKFALAELKKNPESRRAVMIYTRPSMWLDYNRNGRSDFMCTNVVQYLQRDGQLHAVVQMRSNDAWAGYRNDRAWQMHILKKMAAELSINVGNLYWNVGSLHVYARNYYLVDNFIRTADISISKAEYSRLYPDSEFA